MKSYAVIFTYSFDCDAAVYLFDTHDAATNFLEQSYKEEMRIDTEENGWNTEGFINEDKTYAKIMNVFDEGDDPVDITEFHLGRVYE